MIYEYFVAGSNELSVFNISRDIESESERVYGDQGEPVERLVTNYALSVHEAVNGILSFNRPDILVLEFDFRDGNATDILRQVDHLLSVPPTIIITNRSHKYLFESGILHRKKTIIDGKPSHIPLKNILQEIESFI